MKKRERKTGRRFHAIANSQTIGRKPEELEPGVLACYVRQAEKKVLPIIKELKPGPAAAQFLLAQQTRVLVTNDPLLTVESGMAIANAVLQLWQDGYYSPGTDYPYTLLETLQDLQQSAKAKQDYTKSFQPFTPVNEEPAHGNRQVAAGIVKHPETQLWQIWAIPDGPCVFFYDGNLSLMSFSSRGIQKPCRTRPRDAQQQRVARSSGQIRLSSLVLPKQMSLS